VRLGAFRVQRARSRRVLPDQRGDLERLAQYIIRNPFAVEKMQVNPSGGTIVYRSATNPKIRRNFEVFIPSAKWRELIKKIWEADPLLCARCSREMKIVALIDDRAVIEHILRRLGLWEQGVRVTRANGPPYSAVVEPCPYRRKAISYQVSRTRGTTSASC